MDDDFNNLEHENNDKTKDIGNLGNKVPESRRNIHENQPKSLKTRHTWEELRSKSESHHGLNCGTLNIQVWNVFLQI